MRLAVLLVIVGVFEVFLPWKMLVSSNLKVLLFQTITLTLGYGEAMLLANAATDFTKFQMGFLRPDFKHRCFGKETPTSSSTSRC